MNVLLRHIEIVNEFSLKAGADVSASQIMGLALDLFQGAIPIHVGLGFAVTSEGECQPCALRTSIDNEFRILESPEFYYWRCFEDVAEPIVFFVPEIRETSERWDDSEHSPWGIVTEMMSEVLGEKEFRESGFWVHFVPLRRNHGGYAGFLMLCCQKDSHPDDRDVDFETIQSQEQQFVQLAHRHIEAALERVCYLDEAVNHSRLEAELDAARAVQAALLPEETSLPGLELATYFRSASKASGDWYGFWFDERSRHAYFFIGDVTGHGVSSALLAGVACGAVNAAQYLFNKHQVFLELTSEQRLEMTATSLNDVILRTGKGFMMMTMALLCCQVETGNVTYLSAGHPPLLHLRKSRRDAKILSHPGPRLGFLDAPRFYPKKFTLEKGDSLVLYTDGLFCNDVPEEKQISIRSMGRNLKELSGAQQILGRLLDDYHVTLGDKNPDDDLSLIVIGRPQ